MLQKHILASSLLTLPWQPSSRSWQSIQAAFIVVMNSGGSAASVTSSRGGGRL